MGKKRRILTRTTKFAKKYFEFLDKADGTDNDIIDMSGGRGDPFIDGLVVTDRNNHTVKLSGRAIGFGTGDKIQWSFDGEAFKPDDGQAITATGTGLDKIKIDETTEVTAVAGSLTTGKHSVRVRKLNETNEDLYATADISIREHLITVGGLSTAFTELSDNIKFDASALTITGKQIRGAGKSAAALGDTSTNALKIEVSTGTSYDAANRVKVGSNANDVTIAIGQNYNNTSNDDDTLMHGTPLSGEAQGSKHSFTVRVTPFESDGTELTQSRVEHTIEITKA